MINSSNVDDASAIIVKDNKIEQVEHITNVYLSELDMQEASSWRQKLNLASENLAEPPAILKPMVEFLIASLEPSKIYMLRHDDIEKGVAGRYFELMIVMPNGSSPFKEYEPILKLSYLKSKQVRLSIHDEGQVIHGLKRGQLYYCMFFTPDRVIYEKSKFTYPVARVEHIELMCIQADEKFTKCFERASDFFVSAASEFGIISNSLTLFMLHQAVELTCRAVLDCLGGYTIKEHALKILFRHLERHAPQLVRVFNGIDVDDDMEDDVVDSADKDQENKLFHLLERAYIAARYDNGFDVDADAISLLLWKVKQFQNLAVRVVKTRIADFQKGLS